MERNFCAFFGNSVQNGPKIARRLAHRRYFKAFFGQDFTDFSAARHVFDPMAFEHIACTSALSSLCVRVCLVLWSEAIHGISDWLLRKFCAVLKLGFAFIFSFGFQLNFGKYKPWRIRSESSPYATRRIGG